MSPIELFWTANDLYNAGLAGMQALPHAWLVSDFGSNWISVDLLQNYPGRWNVIIWFELLIYLICQHLDQNYPGSLECHLQSGLHLKLQSIACRGKAMAGVADPP